MINSYKYFKKKLGVFFGLDFISSTQITFIILPILYISGLLELKINSPLFLFLLALGIFLSALIIKANSGDEVEGFYSSILWHPFKNHIYPYPKANSYDSLLDLISIKKINSDILQTKENDLISILKFENSLALKNSNNESKDEILCPWKNYLSSMKSISDWTSYLDIGSSGDLLQIFTEVNSLKNTYSFIPNPEFYLIYKQKSSESKLKNLVYKYFPKFFKREELTEDELNTEKRKLEKKLLTLNQYLNKMGLNTKKLEDLSLENFIYKHVPALNPNAKGVLKDRSRFLEIENRKLKIYRMIKVPNSGDLNFWLYELIKYFKCEGYISIHIESRNSSKDLEEIRFKSEFITKVSKSSSAEKNIFLEENKKISEEILNSNCSFDLSVFICLVTKDLNLIEESESNFLRLDNDAIFSNLDRMQVENWINSLPLGVNNLKNSSKLFSGLAFTTSLFNVIEEQIGSKNGYYIGDSIENFKPVLINESDKNYSNNRMINFIGDSGSGKSVTAKLSIKKRLEQGSNFIVVDNTKDGWTFFMDYLAGKVIEISSTESKNPFFNPFEFNGENLNSHILDLLVIFSTLKSEKEKLNAIDENFLINSFKDLYKFKKNPCLSDLYELWVRKKFSDSAVTDSWIEIISPYTKKTDGIYSSLMDGNNASINENKNLQLVTFSKLENNSKFQELSLALLVQNIKNRVLEKKDRNLYLVIDEAWKLFYSSRAREIFSYFTRAGRALGLGLWMISQKPSDLPREIHSSASYLICFQLKENEDRAEIKNLANLNDFEKALLESPTLYNPGNCFIKSVRDSGLVKVTLDPIEKILCNSDREFVDRREKIFNQFLEETRNRNLAAHKTMEKILNE